MQNKQNQTEPSWLAQYATDLGTGIFILPDVTQPKLRAYKKELVQDITYQDCVQRGALTIAFKWVPKSVSSYMDIKSTTCGHEPCIDTCVEPGCTCVDGMCQ